MTRMANSLVLLGGNGFIGARFCEELLRHPSFNSFNVFALNRGKSNDWNKAKILQKCATFVEVNRKHRLRDNKQLQLTMSQTGRIHAVVDFSGYKKAWVQESVDFFKKRTAVYIYISTDSVYEVCRNFHRAHSLETDAIRPADPQELNDLADKDKYGHKKLECEELIVRNAEPMDYIILRLADVIGPRDSTDRFWQLMLWIQACSQLKLPVFMPAQTINRTISLVYSVDVARLLVELSTADRKRLPHAEYNLACDENPSVIEFVQRLAAALHCSVDVKPGHGPEIYPSVERGPIDTSRAKKHLLWQPTKVADVIRETVSFYKHVSESNDYRDEKADIVDTMKDDLEDCYIKEDFRNILRCVRSNLNIPVE